MIENASDKLAKLKSAILMWYTIMSKIREEYKKNKGSSLDRNDLARANNLKNEILELENQLKLTPSDRFRILMELI